MEHVTKTLGFDVFLELEPKPIKRLNTCDYGGIIKLVFKNNKETIIVQFLDVLENTKPESILFFGKHALNGTALANLEKQCWRALHKSFGIYPAVFAGKKERELFFQDKRENHLPKTAQNY